MCVFIWCVCACTDRDSLVFVRAELALPSNIRWRVWLRWKTWLSSKHAAPQIKSEKMSYVLLSPGFSPSFGLNTDVWRLINPLKTAYLIVLLFLWNQINHSLSNVFPKTVVATSGTVCLWHKIQTFSQITPTSSPLTLHPPSPSHPFTPSLVSYCAWWDREQHAQPSSLSICLLSSYMHVCLAHWHA